MAMRILVLNAGSSSLKYQLIETGARAEHVLVKGAVERIGSPGSPVHNHTEAVEEVLAATGPVDGVGHRVVHGGENCKQSALITLEVERAIADCCSLAPLHNPHHLACYRAAHALLPGVPHVAVFDTAFFQSLPRKAFLYGLPYEYYQNDHIRRYGFHGTSHRYVSAAPPSCSASRPTPPGSSPATSATAARSAPSTAAAPSTISMGLTPQEGVLMGTRSGDIDIGVIFHLARQRQMSLEAIERLLIHGRRAARPLRPLERYARPGAGLGGRRRARAHRRRSLLLPREKIHRRVWAVLGGADAIVFTGGIGENRAEVRAEILDGLGCLGGVEGARHSHQ